MLYMHACCTCILIFLSVLGETTVKTFAPQFSKQKLVFFCFFWQNGTSYVHVFIVVVNIVMILGKVCINSHEGLVTHLGVRVWLLKGCMKILRQCKCRVLLCPRVLLQIQGFVIVSKV
eukprot:TRINITY_DN645_c1_g1_i1.p4 TRINITY_DN645_c1_g1~~TRINITY_DN645_c1_g1_i1.p4  ORF type:complete len:118 (+),score=3.16 TRINITY_DN645_c1_g1_i1:360-713(+)